MFSKVIVKAKLAVFFSLVAIALPACNMDPVYGTRQLREEQEPAVYAARLLSTNPARDGVDFALADAHEVDLVEGVVQHRGEYHRRLGELHDYYVAHGYATKATWAEMELDGLGSVRAFRYLLDAEIPVATLRPTESIAEADALYDRGRDLMRKGGHGVPIFYRQKVMIEAACVFRDLIKRYPSSDKIDDAAFYSGEIHKEYLPGLESIAVKWYERAWEWDPDTPHPARFRAAVVYDFHLHDRDRALELYQHVVRYDTDTKRNVRFATRRIKQLTAATPPG